MGTAGTGAGGSGTGGSGGARTCLSHDIDVPAAYVGTTITVQGISSSTGIGTLDLRTAAGDNARLGDTMVGQGTGTFLPGTYDVYYRLDKAGPGLPVNHSAKILSGVVVPPGDIVTMLDIVVPATPVSAAVTSNGGIPPGFGGDALRLRTAAGDEAPLGLSATPVVPGTYDLYYVAAYTLAGARSTTRPSCKAGSSSARPLSQSPWTSRARRSPESSPSPARAFAWGPTPWGCSSRPPASTPSIAPQLGTYTASLIPGTYDLYFRGYGGVSGVNDYRTYLLQPGLVLASTPLTLNMDVPMTTVTGTITVNGAQVPSTAGMGRLVLQNATTSWPFAPHHQRPLLLQARGRIHDDRHPRHVRPLLQGHHPGPGRPEQRLRQARERHRHRRQRADAQHRHPRDGGDGNDHGERRPGRQIDGHRRPAPAHRGGRRRARGNHRHRRRVFAARGRRKLRPLLRVHDRQQRGRRPRQYRPSCAPASSWARRR